MHDRAMTIRRITGPAVLAAAVVFTLAACGSSESADGRGAPSTAGAESVPVEGVVEFEVPEATHTDAPVEYDQTPPVGGPHSPVWQDCAAYSAPVPSERAVHALEHGAVWITYDPSLAPEGVAALSALSSSGYVLVSPWEGDHPLPSPVVASAWGAQIQADDATDPRLEEFLVTYRQALSSPEPGAPCTGGSAETL